MKVYHGSYTKIETIDLLQCKPNKDFGRGFYVTKFFHHAKKWSESMGRKHKTQGVITEFEYNENAFAKSICNIKHFSGYNEEWLDFVVMNRNENIPEPAHNYDIVEGPVADDKVQSKINLYLEGDLSKAKFLEDLTYHEETHQICFCTMQSLQMLIYAEKTQRKNITNVSEPLIEKLMLERNINEVQALDVFYSSNTFAKFSDKSTELYLKSWQEIYELLRMELEAK